MIHDRLLSCQNDLDSNIPGPGLHFDIILQHGLDQHDRIAWLEKENTKLRDIQDKREYWEKNAEKILDTITFRWEWLSELWFGFTLHTNPSTALPLLWYPAGRPGSRRSKEEALQRYGPGGPHAIKVTVNIQGYPPLLSFYPESEPQDVISRQKLIGRPPRATAKHAHPWQDTIDTEYRKWKRSGKHLSRLKNR